MKKFLLCFGLSAVIATCGFFVGFHWSENVPQNMNTSSGLGYDQPITNTTPINNAQSTSRSDIVEDYCAATATVLIYRTSGETKTQLSFGSGVAVHAGGYIVTNHHVISRVATDTTGTYSISILYEKDGERQEAEAKLLWSDSAYDLAIIRTTYVNMPYVEMSDRWIDTNNPLRIAEEIWTLGSPSSTDLYNTYTEGTIASKDKRNLLANGNVYEGLIQHNADIGNGSSGSGLFDKNGFLIGLNTAGLVDSISNNQITVDRNGIYFAVPIYPITQIIEKVAYYEQDGDPATNYSYPKVGINVYDSIYTELIGSAQNTFLGKGLYVSGLIDGGAAQTAGLTNNVAIIGMETTGLADNKYYKINNRNDFTNALIRFSSGDTVKFYYTDVTTDFQNGDNVQDIEIILG